MISLPAIVTSIFVTGGSARKVDLFCSAAGVIFLLHRRTFHRTIRTKDAAVARLRTQQHFAVRAFVKILACIGRHGFLLSETAKQGTPAQIQEELRS
jgi:hypothetical protein